MVPGALLYRTTITLESSLALDYTLNWVILVTDISEVLYFAPCGRAVSCITSELSSAR